jgi:hypothetical protein
LAEGALAMAEADADARTEGTTGLVDGTASGSMLDAAGAGESARSLAVSENAIAASATSAMTTPTIHPRRCDTGADEAVWVVAIAVGTLAARTVVSAGSISGDGGREGGAPVAAAKLSTSSAAVAKRSC